MGFGSALLKLIPFLERGEIDDAGMPEALTTLAAAKSQPPLIVLVSDASGLASFQLHSFEDAESAAGFVKNWSRYRLEEGIIAFWALTRQPGIPALRRERRP